MLPIASHKTTTTSTKLSSHVRHDRYYFHDGNVVFLVETTLFNVHRYFLQRDSLVFQDMFSLPHDGLEEGCRDSDPIHLEGVKVVDMERFLSVLYPARIGQFDLHSAEEWTSVLALAHRWQFDAICNLAAQQLQRVAPLADQIALARQYHLPALLLSARVRICEREEAVSLKEGRLLGLEECIIIGEVRQKARCNAYATVAIKFDEWDVRMLQKAFEVLE